MKTIVIGTGLTNECLGTRHQYLTSRRSVGEREVRRLLGKGKAAGEGPLTSMLEACAAAPDVGVILIGAAANRSASDAVHDPGAFISPLVEVVRTAKILPAEGDVIPWQALLEAVSGLTGAEGVGRGLTTRFLVVGSHTDTEILAVSAFLKRTLGVPHVAVCAHLVGSATLEAHLSTLRHTLPTLGIGVFLDLEETAEWTGLDPTRFAAFDARPCAIGPPATLEAITEDQKAIIELLCLHWTRTHVRPIAGGFSGSLLLLADGWKGEARTEPMVLKIDSFDQMRRELGGYYQVKDFFGKHVPTFGYPVTRGDLLGVGMELAAMEGTPETLQDNFEEAEDEADVLRFMTRFEKALGLLTSKLYRNTKEPSSVVPYRKLGLHAERQLEWLKENAELILGYVKDAGGEESHIGSDYLATMLKLIARNEDGVESDVCVGHGDLNLANVICDEGGNIWFIDWTHSGMQPLELDFAKLENDVKFVMSKDFDVEDLPRLRKFEEFLLTNRIPSDVDGLPETLKFAKWDLRFRKILAAVRRVREACFALKSDGEDWLVYRVALLRYASHTLSFDKRRGRGECDVAQLMYALYSVEHLVFILVADDYHLKIRAEKPASYPVRQRILIDSGPWTLDCEDYDPPYYVDPRVLENDRTTNPEGWADPEDVTRIADLAERPAKRRDEKGRPLNPRGRTGIAGRGQLGMWGRNLGVAATVIRATESGGLEILLGQAGESSALGLPRSFVRPSESVESCLVRTLESETGWKTDGGNGEKCFDAYTYDARQTDHAWVEVQAFVMFDDEGKFPETFSPLGGFEEVKWWALTPESVNKVSAGSARFVREAVRHLGASGKIDRAVSDTLLAATG